MPVQIKRTFLRASWTLVDQGIASLGVFLANICLARQLVAEEYGIFALLFGGALGLQVVMSSLIFYPLSVRLAVAEGDRHARLTHASLVLALGGSLLLAGVLGLVLLAFGRGDLAPFAAVWFVLWQTQETMRRCLFANFRHQTAIIGDLVSYLGQVALIVALSAKGMISLPNALAAMAVSSTLGALIQFRQLGLAGRGSLSLPVVIKDYWSLGGWSLANNLMSLVRVQSLPWALAASQGAAATALFQASLNVVNLANPIILGLCNVIPQAAAHAHVHGRERAWQSARVYAFLGAVPTFTYYAAALIVPGIILRIFYGGQTAYLGLDMPVRLLVAAWILAYAVDMICSYLHGIEAARFALAINALGMLAAALLAWPLTHAFGLVGSCIALLGANLVRFAYSQLTLARMTSDERPRLA